MLTTTYIGDGEYFVFDTDTGATFTANRPPHPEAHAAAAAACQPSPVYVVADPVHAGHEAFGAQAVDAKSQETEAMEFLLKGLERASQMLKGADVANAITALHNQHSRDGKPARFMPEGY